MTGYSVDPMIQSDPMADERMPQHVVGPADFQGTRQRRHLLVELAWRIPCGGGL
jgi:hypothetical protein